MSANMARQGGWVQLEQSDMRLALNMAKIAKEGFSCAAIEETKYLIKTQHTEVQEAQKRGVEFPGHKKVKAATQRHPAMLRQNKKSGCLPCQNATTKNPQTRWTCKGTGAPPAARCREGIPEPTPPLPGTPPAPTSNSSEAEPAEIINLHAGHTYSHIACPCAEYFEDDEDIKHDTDFDPDMVTDEG